MKPRLPGDVRGDALRARILRVDHAGELAAARIYDGQLAVLRATTSGSAIREMSAQERAHLETFERLMVKHGVRPTAFAPLWRAAGYALGAASALAGPAAAMACTAVVEEVIEAHYARQIAELDADADDISEKGERPLREVLAACREDEIAHREHALAAGAGGAPAFGPLKVVIQQGCRAAIRLSERF